MKTPVVSIVVPSYKHAAYLPACLAAVQAQTFSDWELILIDDGSPDDSVAIARQIAASDPRMQVHVNEQNLGTYGTEERGRGMARGKYLAILNSDDLWGPEKLELQVAALEADRDAAFCYTLGWKVDEHGEVDDVEDVHGQWPIERRQEPLSYLLYENRILASSVLFRTDTVHFDPSLRYSGDWVALLSQALLGPAVCLDERLTFWRMHSNNTFVRSPKQLNEEMRVREAIHRHARTWFVRGISEDLLNSGLGMNLLNMAALEILRGRRSAALKYAAAALRFHPYKRLPLRRLIACAMPDARQRLWPRETGVFERGETLAPLKLPTS